MNGNIRKYGLMALGMAALAGQSNMFDRPKAKQGASFAPYKPDKGKTISAGKPKKKPFGERKLSKKQRKQLNNK